MSLKPPWASKCELVSSGEQRGERKGKQDRLRDITLHPKDACYILPARVPTDRADGKQYGHS